MLLTSFFDYFDKARKISQRSTTTSTTQKDRLYVIPIFRSNRIQTEYLLVVKIQRSVCQIPGCKGMEFHS